MRRRTTLGVMETCTNPPTVRILLTVSMVALALGASVADAQTPSGGSAPATAMTEDELRRAIQAAQERLRRRAPPPPPLPAAVYEAYEFRYKLLGNAECMPFAQQADAVLGDAALKDDERVKPLQAIAAAARKAGCIVGSD